jgi:EmrB/QacA subfamily drug resistance transporter
MSVGKSNPRRFWPVFLIVVAAVGMSNLDLFIVNVALPSIGRSIGDSSLAGLSWVLNGYAIAFAALLIVAGRLGDRTGQRGLFLGGATLFTLASAVCATAPNLAVLIAARAVQATGAAALIPTSLALLVAAAPPERRAGAVRAWAAVGGLSAALGPVIGGLLVQLDWRWVFLVNLPIGAVTVLCGLRILARTPVRAEPLPDVLGAPLLAVAVGALSAALVQAPTWGWASTRTLVLLGLAAMAFAAFALRSRRHAHPLIEFGLLRTPAFGASSAATFLFSVGFATMLLSNVLWLQDIWHYGPVLTGLAIAPGPAMVPLVALGSGRLIRRFGPGPVATVGNLVFGAGLVLRALVVHSGPNYLVDFLPSMLLTGTGVGLTLPTLLSAATTALPTPRVATGSAILNTGRQVASALGIAVLVTLLGTHAVGDAAPDVYRRAWLVSAAIMVVAAIASVAVRRPALAVSDRGSEHIDGPDNELVSA